MACNYPHNGPDPESKVDYDANERAIDKSTGVGDCCQKSNALGMARSIAAEAARSQGGTELISPDGSKGNTGQIGLGREATNSDPQGFKWTDQPRLDRDGG